MARPSKYKPEYCDQLEEHMADGLSFESFGGVLSVDRATLYRWRDEYPEFKKSFEVGYTKGLLFYEKLGKRAILGEIEDFNSAIYCFGMKNRFGWVDKVETKIEGSSSIQINYSLVDEK